MEINGWHVAGINQDDGLLQEKTRNKNPFSNGKLNINNTYTSKSKKEINLTSLQKLQECYGKKQKTC